MRKSYAGIGSRETPPNMKPLMQLIAQKMEEKGYILRSGAAFGADQFFESGVKEEANKEIYLPWKEFNGSKSSLYSKYEELDAETDIITKKYHPNYDTLTFPAKKLLGRNAYQVLGPKLNDPVKLVICWTVDGKVIGGTGQAMRIAMDKKIPIINLALNGELKILTKQLGIVIDEI
jgi:hypothetical protein